MELEKLANLILPNVKKDISYYENLYPKRNISKDAIVTRFAPSPTGFVHIGGLLASFVETKIAKQTNGVCFLRIEDTDQKREILNGVQGIIDDMNKSNIFFDEGPISESEEKGNYGPYVQSKRKEIYQTFAHHLLKNDKAYACFCTESELDNIRIAQEQNKARIGYYGSWARDRYLTSEEVEAKIKSGEEFIVRLKSNGNFNNKKTFSDLIKGDLVMPENDQDIVIIKSDGLPTYHFAHLVDDHLMRTTHIIRADEWLSSLPIHVQLFEMFGFVPLKYAHISPLTKSDNGGIRKISKRKDPEAAVSYYHQKGIPNEAITIYLATIANSDFEAWYDENPNKNISEFELKFSKISSSGSMFDIDKLLNISKNYISRLTSYEVYEKVYAWALEYDDKLRSLLEKHKDFSINIFNVERGGEKPRKDYTSYSDIINHIWYMYDELFIDVTYDLQKINEKPEIEFLLKKYMSDFYDKNDSKEEWFNKIKELCKASGYAHDMKEYKANPEKFKGNVADISMMIRVILTSKTMTPDLYEIMNILGSEKIKSRIEMYLKS